MASGEQVTLSQAIENTFMTLISNLHTCLPGRIETYDFKRQKATVKPLIKKKFFGGNISPLPILTNVPVVFPRTKKAGITFPLSRGDGVLIVFSERSLEAWYSSGDDSEPQDSRKFDLSDAICIPGLYSFNQGNIASNNNSVEIQNKDGEIGLGQDTSKTTIVFDGLVTGKSINPFTGTPYSQLPGVNANGKNTSLKVRAEF